VIRKSIVACVMTLLCSSSWAGLGAITVRSHMGEPFFAVVELTDAGSMNPGLIQATLADRATFRQMNVDMEPQLSGLSFSVQAGSSGPVVAIRSRTPILSSYVRFVLEVRTPAGRWVRDYTALFDKPDAKPAAPAAAAAHPPGRLKVPAGATLAAIAHQVQAPGVSLNQTMAALFLENPRQFRNQDPQHLLPGAELTVPPAERMRALTEERARTLLQRPGSKGLALPPAESASAHAPAHPANPQEKHAQTAPGHVAAPAVTHAPAPAVTHTPAPAHPPAEASVPLTGSPEILQSLQQQVARQDRDLQGTNQRINDLKQQIKQLEALPAQAKSSAVKQAAPGKKGLLLWLGLGVLALLGLVFWLWRRRRSARPGADDSLSPGSLASTGVVAPAMPDGTSPGGDVLAEAEVYLAYQHDQQAEDILRQGLEQDPSRQDLRAKLLEIYAARPDLRKFELLAIDVYDAYDGRGAAWERTRAMGLAIDPANTLYQPGGSPQAEGGSAEPADGADMRFDFDLETPLVTADKGPAAEPDHSMLDFDFSLEGGAPAATAPVAAEEASIVAAEAEAGEPVIDLASRMEAAVLSSGFDEMNLSGFDDVAPPAASAVSPAESAQAAPADVPVDEALSTKLDLARVYLDMGDSDGAREVLLELQAEASGTMKQQVDVMLASLAAGA